MCHDIGWVGVLDGQAYSLDAKELVGELYSARECNCKKQERIKKLFAASNISDKYRSKGFKNVDVTLPKTPRCLSVARDEASRYYKNFAAIRHQEKNSLALLGASGGGKTHILMAVSNGLMRDGIPILYFPWAEGFSDLKGDRDAIEKKLRHMREVDVLFIDDLFKGNGTPTKFEFDSMFGVLNFRVQNGLPMLISSEYGIDTIREYDNAIGRRIEEVAVIVHMALEDGEDAILDYTLRRRSNA